MSSSTCRRLARLALWAAVVVAYVAAIVPGRDAPSLGWSDKVDHMAAFLTITVLARLAHPRIPVWRLLLVISAFGAFIELCQAVPFIHRDAEWADWLADTTATVAGLVLAWPAVPFMRRGTRPA